MDKELLFEGKENANSVNIKEFSAEGAKVDITLPRKISGKVTCLIMTTHNALMKPDGTGDVDLRSIIFSSGEPVFMWGTAISSFVDPYPIQRVEENLTFQTSSQRLAFLNTTKGLSEGFYNLATGEYSFKVYAAK